MSMTCWDTKNGCLSKHWRTNWNFEGFLGFRMQLSMCRRLKIYNISKLDSCGTPEAGLTNRLPGGIPGSVTLRVYSFTAEIGRAHV